MGMDRREMLRSLALGCVGVGATAASVVAGRAVEPSQDPIGEASIRTLKVLDQIPPSEGEDVLLRMQRDLKKAMAKPMEKRHWIMVIDSRKCVGCHACTIGCVSENKLPPGVVYRPVITEERGEFPNVHLRFTPRPCMHCQQPSCVEVCPVGATWKRKDGIVIVDYDSCIGCRYCLTACPYGARTSDFGEYYTKDVAVGSDRDAQHAVQGGIQPYEKEPNHELGKHFLRDGHGSPVGNARKCHFCVHRLEEGRLPVCVSTCIGRATYFGDQNDPDSLVVELITKNNVDTLLPEKGTKPQVFYLI